MKMIIYFILSVFIFTFAGCAGAPYGNDTLFQISTINALMDGAYRGQMTIGQLKKYGDFGIGTLDALDGEMLALDGKFYQIKADGIAYPVPNSMTTPFAIITVFDKDKTVPVHTGMDYEEIQRYLDNLILDKDIFYAVKIEGTFKYIKTRSVPRQKEPYPPLIEAVKKQTVFEFNDVKGTVVGFWCPDFVKGGVNVPGYHFHFITADRKAGGHLLSCWIKDAMIDIDYTTEFYLVLPKQKGTLVQLGPGKDRGNELKKIEQE